MPIFIPAPLSRLLARQAAIAIIHQGFNALDVPSDPADDSDAVFAASQVTRIEFRPNPVAVGGEPDVPGRTVLHEEV